MVNRVRRFLLIAVVLAVAVTGCGGSDPDPDNTASVNQIQTFADQQLELRLDANQSAEPFACEEDGDAQNWKCTTEVRADNPDANADDDVVQLTVKVTCDDAANCTYVPET